MKRIQLRTMGFLWVTTLVLLVVGFAPNPKKEKLKGTYYIKAAITEEAKGKTCRVDSAQGMVIRFDQDHENPLFPSKLPNQVHLLLWFKNDIQFGQPYQLPSPDIQVCYWEQGDLLMFHTTKALGSIQFSGGEMGAKASGKMELKLVEPDHNMSNSDYHYMGGEFQLKAGKF